MSHAPADAILRLAQDPADRQAWEDVVTAHSGLCWRIALRLLGDANAAEDAVQDCLLAIRASANRFRPGSDPAGAATAWVARIAVNTCHNARRRGRREEQSLPPDLTANTTSPDTGAEHLPSLRAALADLPAGQREAITLRYLANLDFAAVAQGLGIDDGAARVRVHRGLARLRSLLTRRGVALSVAPIPLLESLAAIPPPPVPMTAVAAWKTASLPSLVTATPIGVIAMSFVLATGLGTILVLATSEPAQPPAPAPVVTPAPSDEGGGLGWFNHRQSGDGSWWPDDPAYALSPARVRLTAKIVLGYLGAGYDHKTPNQHRVVVQKAIDWLVAHPETDGDLSASSMRAMALSEAFAMTNDPALRPHATQATTRLLAARLGPAWPQRIGGTTIDLHTTAFATMALKSYMAAGGDGVLWEKPLDEIRIWLETLAEKGGSVSDEQAVDLTTALVFLRRYGDGRFRPWIEQSVIAEAKEQSHEYRWLANLAVFERVVGDRQAQQQWCDKEEKTTVPALKSARQTQDLETAASMVMALEVVYRCMQLQPRDSAPPTNGKAKDDVHLKEPDLLEKEIRDLLLPRKNG